MTIQGTSTVIPHAHDAWQCPEHARGCSCPDLTRFLCNPYWVGGYCPDGLLVMPDDPRYVPEPRRGGTFLYCPWTERHHGGGSWCLGRFRKAARYRRHWRRAHAG